MAKGTSSWLYTMGVIFLALLAAAFLTAGAGGWLFETLAVLAGLSGILFALLLNFFRDPERVSPEGIVAPADGVVTLVEQMPDGGFRMNTFMSPLHVHVNRAPIDSTVVRITHHPGGYLPAFTKESERNERLVWELDSPIGPVKLVQIAGAMARRIIPYLQEGEAVSKGERIGIIRLGSRVDLYLPPGPQVLVKVGDNVVAGETQIAALP